MKVILCVLISCGYHGAFFPKGLASLGMVGMAAAKGLCTFGFAAPNGFAPAAAKGLAGVGAGPKGLTCAHPHRECEGRHDRAR
jgi:hypothetical protein